MARPSKRRVAGPLIAAMAAVATAGGCHRGPRPDWDRAAFALEIARDEYPELSETGDFRDVPKLGMVLDDALAGLGAAGPRTRALTDGLYDLRDRLFRHEPPRVVRNASARMLATLAASGAPLRRPTARPDLARGAATYGLACVPCHGPPSGPPPPAAANLVPPPTRPTESVLTPYELFNRITYGGAGTAMPSYAETLSTDRRWDVAFYLFAERWFPCAPAKPLPSLSAAELAHLTDEDLWRRYGWGSAACLRRSSH
jgi:mono/diheme cytochrome c family protein